MRRFLAIGLAVILGASFCAPISRAQTTGCCLSGQASCINGLTQSECDVTYLPGQAGSSYYSGKTCSQVPVCSVAGKCEKTDGSACSDNQKWQCDALYNQGYRFFQGQSCSVATPSTGTCCVQNSSGVTTIPFCEPDIDPATCSGTRQGTFYSKSCNLVANCPQAIQQSSPGTTTPSGPKPDIVFDPEIQIPFFSSGAVSGTTFAQYVRAIFIGFIWAVGIVAVAMVIFGGVRWVAAAGNPARINQAKDVVFNAIIGLIIALTAVLLLSLLDPRLVNFEGLSATSQLSVKPIPYETDYTLGKFDEGLSCKTASDRSVEKEATCALGGTKLIWPVANVNEAITSRVGPRDPGAVGSTCHPGTDFATDQQSGKTIVAPFDGVIQAVAPSQRCGEFTMELHADTFYVRLVHVKVPSRTNGERVTKGQLIGYTGGDPNDGAQIKSCSGGPHLHVELYISTNELHDIVPCLAT